jgi:hypothetical protein
MTAPTWAEVAKVLESLAAVLWPAVIVFAIFRFQNDVRGLIAGLKLRRGKILGQEFELDELDKLEKETRALQQANDAVVPVSAPNPLADVQKILGEAVSSPKAALMVLQAEIERRLRLALRNRGVIEDRVPYRRAIDFFENKGEVPAEFGRWLTDFRDVRNRILHGREATDDDALRAIDIGLRMLPLLDRIANHPPPITPP